MELQANLTANATKLMAHPYRLHEWQIHHKMKPITLLISPTNKCNLHCEFCFADSRDKTLELSLGEAITCTKHYIDKGILGVEISGGGEPTLWPHLEEYVRFCRDHQIDVGLVTNGRKLVYGEVPEMVIHMCKWIRVSCNSFEKPYHLCGQIPKFPIPSTFGAWDADQVFSFSYIWQKDGYDQHIEYIKALLEANPKARVLKIQQDMLSVDPIPESFHPKVFVKSKSGKPHEQCYMHVVKPQLLADGKVYRCSCLPTIRSDMAVETWWGQEIENPKFKTADCEHCDFTGHNMIMDMLKNGTLHDSFV